MSEKALPEMKRINVVKKGSAAEAMQLVSAPIPQPKAGEVRLKVEAVGINFADALAVSGDYLTETTYPYTPGMEYAGTIDMLGEGVSGFEIGQRVAVLGGQGGMAQYAVAPVAALVRTPPHFTPAQTAAFAVSYLTGYHALRTLGHAKEGEWVLVQGAAGALGNASIQLAKAMNLQVLAFASTEEKLQLARDAGADVTLLQDDPQRVQKVRETAGGSGVPLILEIVGGTRFQESLEMVADRGRIIFIGNASREDAHLNPVQLMKRNITVTGLWLSSLLRDPVASAQATQEVPQLLATGKIVPRPGSNYALADSAQAFQDLLNRKTTGKVIIEPWR